MLTRILAAATFSSIVALLTGCSSTPPPAATPLQDQRLSTEFTDEGIKLHYTLTGRLDRIEVHGQADAWKGNVDVLAEADAFAKLTKFIYGSRVANERKVRLIARAIEKAADQKTAGGGALDSLEFTDRELEADDRGRPGTDTPRRNVSDRTARILNETVVDAVTTITSRGHLVGVRKVRDRVADDGRLYVAVYQWSPKDQDAADTVRARMLRAPKR
jgi:hypothetical protein